MPINITLILIAAALVAGSIGGCQFQKGQAAIASSIEERATVAATTAAASAIAAIEITNTTIYRKVQTNVKENQVYRSASCVHPAAVMRDINAAFE